MGMITLIAHEQTDIHSTVVLKQRKNYTAFIATFLLHIKNHFRIYLKFLMHIDNMFCLVVCRGQDWMHREKN